MKDTVSTSTKQSQTTLKKWAQDENHLQRSERKTYAKQVEEGVLRRELQLHCFAMDRVHGNRETHTHNVANASREKARRKSKEMGMNLPQR